MRRGIATTAGVLAITAGTVIVAWIVFERLVDEPEPSATRAGARAAAPAGTVQVLSVNGTVERSSPLGTWEPVAAGDQLGAEDSIRTSAFSTAELAVGERSHMTIDDATQITVREVTAAVQRFRLTRGRIAVDYGQDLERRLRIEDESGRTVETKRARFGVLATDTMLAVATETGTVTLRARGASVEVGEGQQAAARDGRPPSPPEPIPGALLLKVASAAAHLERDECEAVAGAVSPASSIAVDGKAVPIGDDGRFLVRARRRRGQTAVVITVTDALGRTTQRAVPCREMEPSVKDLSVRWKR